MKLKYFYLKIQTFSCYHPCHYYDRLTRLKGVPKTWDLDGNRRFITDNSNSLQDAGGLSFFILLMHTSSTAAHLVLPLSVPTWTTYFRSFKASCTFHNIPSCLLVNLSECSECVVNQSRSAFPKFLASLIVFFFPE